MPISPQARDLVIRVILAEARGEGPVGQRAVADVILNRLNSGAWGDPEKGALTRLLTERGQFAAPFAATGPADPLYQQVGAIVDNMAAQPTEDTTSGATHFYSPANMPGGAEPSWAVGQQGRRVGGHVFYTLPFNAANTGGAVDLHAPPSGAAGGADDSKAFLASISAHGDRPGDTANLNPQFASRLAAAIKQAQAAGLNVRLESAFREPGQLKEKGDTSQASSYDAGGNSSHSYGLAVDIAGLDGPNGPITQRWAQIAEANGLNNPYGVGNAKEFNHWQLPPVPLEQTPQLLASLKAAKATGNYENVWSAYSGASPESQVATRQSYPPVASPGPAPAAPAADVPAPDVQPVKAPQGPPAASPAAPDANARFLVNTGMSTGVQGRPQLFTSLNLGGGAASPPAASAAPKLAQPLPDLAQRVPPDKTPTPPPRPPDLAAKPLSPDLTAPNNAAGGRNPNNPDPRFGNMFASAAPPLGTPPSPDVTASIQRLLASLFSSNQVT